MASTTRTPQAVPVIAPIQEGATATSGSSTFPDGTRFPVVALLDETNPDRKIVPSGADLTQPVSVQGSASFVGGGTQSASTSASALNSGTSLACTEVYVQNDPASTVNIAVGYSGAQTLVLTPGSGMSVQISNVNLVYIKTASSTATANWLARG